MKMKSKTLLIFLHGSGGNGPELRSFLDSVPLQQFGLKTFRHVATDKNIDYICPTAIERPYTPAMGEYMNVWFDRSSNFIRKGITDSLEDVLGAANSVTQILDLVSNIQASYTDIFFGGFSQGGCLCLHLLREEFSSRLPDQARGIFSMGSFLIDDSVVLAEQRVSTSRPQSDLPILMMHGEEDSMIRYEWGEHTATSLLLKDRDVQFKNYPGVDHEIAVEELTDLLLWMDDITSKNNAQLNANAREKHDTNTKAPRDVDDTRKASDQFDDRKVDVATESLETGTKGIGSEQERHGEHPYVPYTIQRSNGDDSVITVVFNIPSDMVDTAIARPVLACGGSFEFRKSDHQSHIGRTGTTSVTSVQTEIISSEPDFTAQEIGKRLFIRLGSDGASLRACPMS